MQDSPNFQDGSNLTKIWDSITHEFFDGWKIQATIEESQLIDFFLTRPKYLEILETFVNEHLGGTLTTSYSNLTEVIYDLVLSVI